MMTCSAINSVFKNATGTESCELAGNFIMMRITNCNIVAKD